MTDTLTFTPLQIGGPLWSLDENKIAEEQEAKGVVDHLPAGAAKPGISSPPPPPARKPRRPTRKPNSKGMNVKMNPQVRYREIPHLNNISLEEIRATWLQPDEIKATKTAYTEIVRMMMKSREPIEDTDELCTRGLGKLT
jgi:hypothetical protein